MWAPDRALTLLCVSPGTTPTLPVRLISAALDRLIASAPVYYVSLTCDSGLSPQKCQSNQRRSGVHGKGRCQTHLQEKQECGVAGEQRTCYERSRPRGLTVITSCSCVQGHKQGRDSFRNYIPGQKIKKLDCSKQDAYLVGEQCLDTTPGPIIEGRRAREQVALAY